LIGAPRTTADTEFGCRMDHFPLLPRTGAQSGQRWTTTGDDARN
jgi:hypothetical protein